MEKINWARKLKKFDKIVHSYFRNDPFELYNASVRNTVSELNSRTEKKNAELNQQREKLKNEFKLIKDVEKKISGLAEEIKNIQFNPRDTLAAESYNKLVEEHNKLIKDYETLLTEYRKNEDVFNKHVKKINADNAKSKSDIDTFIKETKGKLDEYQRWIIKHGPQKLFSDLNQFYALLIETSKNAEGNSEELTKYLKAFQNLRQEIAQHTKREQSSQKNGALIVQCVLCGQEEVCLSVETGSSVVSLTPEMVKILGIEDHVGDEVELILAGNIRIKAPELLIPSLSVYGHEAKFVKAVVLKHALPGIDGGLGLSFLNRFNFRIERDNPEIITFVEDKQAPKTQTDTTNPNHEYDVFISYNTNDLNYALDIYELISNAGHTPFFSYVVSKGINQNQFQKEIDQALESAYHFILVCSSHENATSKWVEAEWRLFEYLKNTYSKKGNIIPILCGKMSKDELPASFKVNQALSIKEPGWRTALANYLT
jgi:predicted aspartyl protease